MSWSSLSEFFSMGGYGFYVWGSYIVTLICIAIEISSILKRRRTLERHHSHTYGVNRKRDRK